ncbi:MAG: hypothetical protein ACYC67_10500 [Prosthecobacter sp.]
MSWRTIQDYNSHPGAPARRDYLPVITRDRLTLARSRTVITDNTGPVSDTGWGDWGSVGVDLSWIYSSEIGRFGSSWTKVDCMIEVAAGIGRPWQLLWRYKLRDGTTFAESYSAEESKLFLPGDSLTITLDAPDGSYLSLGSGAALVIADAL